MVKKLPVPIILLILTILISGCTKSLDSLEVIKTSQQKSDAANYLIEYATKIETTINGESFSQVFRTVSSKVGTNKKTQVYAKEIVLLQEAIENEINMFSCYYGGSVEDINCLVLDKPQKLPSQDEILKKLLESGIVNIQASTKTVKVGSKELECDNLDYRFDFSKLTPEIEKGILQLASVSSFASEDKGLESIEEFKSATCLDRQTGLPLESYSSIGYATQGTTESISFHQSITQKATRLDINPLLSEKDFAIPENAKLKTLQEEENA